MRIKWCDTQGCCNTISRSEPYGKLARFCEPCALERRREQYRSYKNRVRSNPDTKNPGRARPGQKAPKRKLIPYAGFDPNEGRRW